MAQNVFCPDAWTRAKNRFIEDLTAEEQVCDCQKDSFLLGAELNQIYSASNPLFPHHLESGT